NLRRKDGPFIERDRFEDNDYTAFDLTSENGNPSSWLSSNGSMIVTNASGLRHYAIFGQDDWNHIKIQTRVDPQGGNAGVAVAVSKTSTINRALIAMIDEVNDRLVIIALHNGTTVELAGNSIADLKAPYLLEVTAFDDKLRARAGEIIIDAP